MASCYDVDTEPLARLEGITADQMGFWRAFQIGEAEPDIDRAAALITAFVNAFECLLKIDFAILAAAVEAHRNREHLQRFLPVFQIAQTNSMDAIRRSVEVRLSQRDAQLVELAPAVVLSGMGQELTATAEYLENTRGDVAPRDHAATAETVTGSAKGLVKRYFGFKPLESILEALDEILQLVHGAG